MLRTQRVTFVRSFVGRALDYKFATHALLRARRTPEHRIEIRGSLL